MLACVVGGQISDDTGKVLTGRTSKGALAAIRNHLAIINIAAQSKNPVTVTAVMSQSAVAGLTRMDERLQDRSTPQL